MVEGKKFIVGLCGIVVLILLGGLYNVTILDDRIVVSLPSDVCNSATLRVTKDDFTLKCGRYIAFQADTIIEYWRTYGQNEKGEEAWWVRNNRFVGFNKKHITLELNDYGNYFDIVRKTRYRKGRQNIDDGILLEKYTFTKDKVKISYDYEVTNKALHRISMRIKKQVDSYLDAFDPNGYTGILTNNQLYYEGVGDLMIDPTVFLLSPANATTSYNEGDTIPLICNCTEVLGNASLLTNMTLHWTGNNTIFQNNGTVSISGNTTTTFSRVIPHLTTTNSTGVVYWNCGCCGTIVGGTGNCSNSSTAFFDPHYRPDTPTIDSPDSLNLNFLNGSGIDWNLTLHHPTYSNETFSDSIFINWTHPGIPDNDTKVNYTLWYYGTTNSTPYSNSFFYPYNWSLKPTNFTDNSTTLAIFNLTNLSVDRYYIVLEACNENNGSLCVNATTTNYIEIFDYAVNISAGGTKIRFSPQPTITKGAALGQTDSIGVISIDWLGYSYPSGQINLSINHTEADKCMDIYAYHNNTPASAVHLINQTYVTVLNTTESDPDHIWLWATKVSCGTTTTAFSFDLDLFFGGT